MLRIPVVESNPKVESERLEALSGQALGTLYAVTFEGLRGDVETVLISPYDGDETPDLSGFNGIVFTGLSLEWDTDDERVATLASVMRAGSAAGFPTIGTWWFVFPKALCALPATATAAFRRLPSTSTESISGAWITTPNSRRLM